MSVNRGRPLPLVLLPALLSTVLLATVSLGAQEPEADDDLAAARALFERNLQAIADRDRETYLDCYWHHERLVRTGPEGFVTGFEEFAEEAGDGWPDVFEARDLRLTPIRPGLVYGTYRYRVVYRIVDGTNERRGLSERLFLKTDDGWRIAVTTAFEAPEGTPPPPLALVGATLIDGTGVPPVPDAVIVVRNGLVDCAGSRAACPIPDGIEVVDLSGRWITPGLVDAHVHLSQTGWVDGRPDAVDVRERYPYAEVAATLESEPERFLHSHLCSGVTAIFDVGGYPWTLTLPEDDLDTPHIVAAGPLLSTVDHWVNLPAERQFVHLADEAAARRGVRYLAAHGADAVKVWFIVTDERPFEELAAVVRAAGEAALDADLPLIVHATELAAAKVAVEAGARLLVHSVWDREVDDELVEMLRETGTHYCPTLTVRAGYQRLYETAAAGRVPEIDDPNGCVDAVTAARVDETAELGPMLPPALDVAARRERLERSERITAINLARISAAGVPIVAGTDAGNPLTLHGPAIHAELEAMQAAGMSPMEVIVAATGNGASAMGRGGEFGTLESGKVADLLVLRADPTADVAGFRQLEAVVRGGVLREQRELRAPIPSRESVGE